jgi:RHS repeat-associated protein
MDRWQRRFNQGDNRPSKHRPKSAGVPTERPAAPILERFTYDAYGQQKPTEGPPAADAGQQIGEGFNQMFQGGRVDPEASLIDFRQRDMHPGIARWIDQEPLAYVDGLNVYLAMNDNPINRIEPV